MNNIIKVLLFASTFFVACQNNAKQTVTASKASIGVYSKAVVELAHEHTAYLERLDNSLKKIKLGLQQPTKQNAFDQVKPIFSTPNFIKAAANPNKPPVVLDIKDRMFFRNSIILLNKNFEHINQVYNALTNYITTKEFESDNGKKGKLLVDSLNRLRDDYHTKQTEIFKKLTDLNKSVEKAAHASFVQVALKTTPCEMAVTSSPNLIGEKQEHIFFKTEEQNFTQLIVDYAKQDDARRIIEADTELSMLIKQETELREAYRNFAK